MPSEIEAVEQSYQKEIDALKRQIKDDSIKLLKAKLTIDGLQAEIMELRAQLPY